MIRPDDAEEAKDLSKKEVIDLVTAVEAAATKESTKRALPPLEKIGVCKSCHRPLTAKDRCFECPVCRELYHASEICLAKMVAHAPANEEEDTTSRISQVEVVGTRMRAMAFQLWKACCACALPAEVGIACKNCKRLICTSCVSMSLGNFTPGGSKRQQLGSADED